LKFLFLGFFGYLVVVGGAWSLQGYLMFFPNTTPIEECSDEAGQKVPVESQDGIRYYWMNTGESPQGTVLYYHGNGGRACDRVDFLKPFLAMGYNVLLPEYPGYAESTGRPTEGQVLDVSLRTFDLARKEGDKVLLFGESLGTTVATYVGSQRHDQINGLILQAPFPSVLDVGQDRYFFLPVRWMSNFVFPAEEWAREVNVPVFAYHGTEDAIVPIKFGRKQMENFGSSRKFFWEVEGAGHLNVGTLKAQELWQRLGGFVESL
jgi:pimeloyl-ACP methyl ester carboxylesterase